MKKISFHTSKQLQDWIIQNAHPEDLVLTSGGRMARQILHRFREYKLLHKVRCWLPIYVKSLNDWLESLWTDTWPEYITASEWSRLLIWMKAIRQSPPPGPFLEGLSLAENLDRTYAILVRHMIDPCKRMVSQSLAQWCLDVTQIFYKCMQDSGFIHPAEIPAIIPRIISEETGGMNYQKLALPKRIILAGLDQSSPLEKALFARLDRFASITWLETIDFTIPHPETVTLPDPVQEAEWIAEKAVEASRNLPLHGIGIAVTDMKTYGRLFEMILEDILGERVGEDASAFNITLGKPLIWSSLVQAAILPLELVLAGQTRSHLFSLLQSPYYGIWASQRHKLAVLDRVWRKENLNRNLDHLTDSIQKEYPTEAIRLQHLKTALKPFLGLESQSTVNEWIMSLQAIWGQLGFPGMAGEEDQVAWKHLREGIGGLNKDLSEVQMPLKEFVQWLSFFLSREIFSTKGFEHTGLQVMGLIEARGLSFDRLFIAGMVSGFLPQPARSLPFLTYTERQKVQGGTAEDQYRFAKVLFQKLMSASSHMILSRPEQREGEPLVQSPFWPKEEERCAQIDLWRSIHPVWARCEWLSQARKGMGEKRERPFADFSMEICQGPVTMASDIPVTVLEAGMTCPFKFFAAHCLRIEPLNDVEPGLSPRQKGTMVHRCLSHFVEEAGQKNLDLIGDWDEVRKLLQEKAQTLLAPFSNQFHWSVELKRWLDMEPLKNDNKGLLYQWLEIEKNAWEKGFRWQMAEAPFSGLLIEGSPIRISGRIDRVDHHPEGGHICWDYKTGQIPTVNDVLELRHSQILPYILAIQKGLTPIPVSDHASVIGGYIRLDSPGKIKLFDFPFAQEDWKRLIQKWEAMVFDLFKRMEKGDVRPDPTPAPTKRDEGACRQCSMKVICGYALWGYETARGGE